MQAARHSQMTQGASTVDTIIGKVKLVDNQRRSLWTVGQWQGGKFVGLAHTKRGSSREPVVPKPTWVPAV